MKQSAFIIKYLFSIILLISLFFLDLLMGEENKELIIFSQAGLVLFSFLSLIPYLKTDKNNWLNPSVFFIGFVCLMYVFNAFNYILWGLWGRSESGDFKLVGWINIAGIMGTYLSFIFRGKIKNRISPKYSSSQFVITGHTVLLLLTFFILSLAGGLQIYQGFAYVSLYFTNPDLVRAIYGDAATGIGWLLLKQGYNLAGFSIALLLLFKIDKLSTKIMLLIIIGFSFILFSLYGGRWLPFSLILFLFVLVNRFYRQVNTRDIFVFIVIIFSLSTTYAAYRYTSELEVQMDVDDVVASYFRQGSGANAELGLVLNSISYGEHDLSKLFYQDIAEAALPTPIYILVFGHPKKMNVSLPAYFVMLQGRNGARGLRVTMFGEIYLVFGFLGVLFIGWIVGTAVRWLDKLYDSDNINKNYMAVVLSSQLLSVQLLGFTKIVGVIQFAVLTILILQVFHWKKIRA